MFWHIRGQKLFFEKTLLMGVLNLTPDSFSDGGKYLDAEAAFERAVRLVEEGADILDLGAESTRPGALAIGIEEESDRLIPILKKIRLNFDIPLSIDTTKPEIARRALGEGANIINDVSGLQGGQSRELAEIAKNFGAGLVLMHRRGNPGTMQQMTVYSNVVRDIQSELEESLKAAYAAGLRREQLVIDPGLGFAKTAEQNFEIIQNLERFQSFGVPVMLGPSRKAFLGQVTGRPVNAREFGTAAVAAIAVMKGVQILRVHEVGAIRDAVRTAEAIRGEGHHVRT
ncbi:MAG TPA: dihydropteroate synthase [bacterium]|nr:dihydropteroate synthase [bacterium]